MAWLQCRKGSWRVMFRYGGEQKTFLLGEVKEAEAHATAAKVDYWLMRLKQKLVHLPVGCDVITFVQHDGNPPKSALPAQKDLSLGDLRLAYLAAQQGRLEETTIAGIEMHFDHLQRILGHDRHIPPLLRPDLQKYVDTRAGEWIDPNIYRRRRREQAAATSKRKASRKQAADSTAADKPKRHPSSATIKKEIVSLRTAWNWARRQLGLREEFPGGHLDFAKTEESLPFLTWDEAERRIAAGDPPQDVWTCVFLRAAEIADLLAWVKGRPVSPWVYPMFVVAAHTGARRSEIVRVLPSDLDLVNGVLTIREKKRDKKRLTTRRVPLTPLLQEVMTDWTRTRATGRTLFCKGNGNAISPREAHNYFQRAVRLSRWSVLKGWHVFRHSFISALASNNVDQRLIDDMVGHQTEEQRRRYRHLYPNVKNEAIKKVFG